MRLFAYYARCTGQDRQRQYAPLTLSERMIEVGEVTATPGERDTGRLPIGEAKDGASVELPVAIANGSDDGPTLFVQAASDGNELNGVGVVSRLWPQLDPQELSGAVIIIGVANWHAYQRAEHLNPIDNTKLNRAFPGDPDGSSSERIAAEIFEVAKKADIALDLHQGGTSRMIHEVRVRCGRHHDLHGECLELAKTFNCGHILDKQGPDGQLARVLADEGIPVVDPELGGCVGWDEASIEIGLEGVTNVLSEYGLLDGEVEPTTQKRIGEFDQYHSPNGGLVRFEAELGDQVAAGDPLGTITSVFGAEKAQITAESAGILWRKRRLPHVATGEYVCSVGTDVDEV